MPRLVSSLDNPDDDSSPVATPSSYDETRLVSKIIWKFRILRLIGVGAFSNVYLALDTETDQQTFAIKMIRKANVMQNLRIKSSIEREVAVLQHLRHPGIVQLEATMEIEHHVCLVLEYIQDGDLFDFVQAKRMLNAEGSVDEPLVKGLFLQLVNVVHWIHKQNCVHRDLKLENVLMYSDKHGQLKIKVSDFGLARVIDPEQPILNTRCGSEEYAAPEIVQGIGYDARQTDAWSLGIILFALLAAQLPFTSRDNSMTHLFYQIMQATLRWPKHIPISDHAKQVVQALLMRRPEQRALLSQVPSFPWFLP
ncbi:kinase-like protein [Hesseltinella vesiculosa]|uniref:Kinase-like protein n=1 Tax=Hesseltinella vesiculosa TaxID=101127 RepID=A0A1X2G2S1_9FUNG|nr:kinase-like protein [Hesseltinella vesiculosa]